MPKDPPDQVKPGTTAADLAEQLIRHLGLAAAIGVAYFLAAQLSLGLLTQPDGVAVFWPAAGISAGVLIALGTGARLPVAMGAIAATIMANLIGDRTLWAAIADAFCNAFEALLMAWLVERWVGPRFDLGRLTHVLALLAAAIVATAISGIGGALSYQLFHNSQAPILTTWQHWFTSDAVGIVTVAPVAIGVAAAMRKRPVRRELIEGIVALAALAFMTGVIILLPPELWETVIPVASLFPMLLWLAARCRPVFAAAGSFMVSLTIVSTLIFGVGHFGNSQIPIEERILTAQAGILVVALCALVLAALFAERREHEAELSDSEARLKEALTAGRVTAFDWDLRTGSSRLSETAEQILGVDPQSHFTAADFVARIHPDDRARHQALVDSATPENPSYADIFRFLRSNAREIWLEATATVDFDAAGRPVRLKGLTRDITARKRAEERQDLLIAELDHRVKNVLARVAVVAMYTREGSRSMDEFVKVLDGRIQSMAAAHSLLSESRWHGVDLIDLVHRQVAPYATDANITINGSNAMLSAVETQAVAMVIHELVTNAAKYGALSCPGGHVLVTWRCESRADDPAQLQIEWRESGGPPVQAPVRPGYGTSLIRELIPHELGGKVDLELASIGASCRIEIPFGAVLS